MMVENIINNTKPILYGEMTVRKCVLEAHAAILQTTAYVAYVGILCTGLDLVMHRLLLSVISLLKFLDIQSTIL